MGSKPTPSQKLTAAFAHIWASRYKDKSSREDPLALAWQAAQGNRFSSQQVRALCSAFAGGSLPMLNSTLAQRVTREKNTSGPWHVLSKQITPHIATLEKQADLSRRKFQESLSALGSSDQEIEMEKQRFYLQLVGQYLHALERVSRIQEQGLMPKQTKTPGPDVDHATEQGESDGKWESAEA